MSNKNTAGELKIGKGIEAHPENWIIADLIRRRDDGETNFDVPIQRGYIWDNQRKSLLIHSILINLIISDFLFGKVGDEYEGFDGKQREDAIYNYVKNGYRLHKSTPPVKIKGKIYNVAKHKFSELPEILRNKILQYKLSVCWFDNPNESEKILIFSRINSGKPVTPADLARIKVKSRKVFSSLAEHPAIQIGVKVTAKRKFVDEDVVKTIWYLCYTENRNLTQKYMSPVLEKAEVSVEQEQRLREVFDYMEALFKEAGKIKTTFSKMQFKTHLVSLGCMAFYAINNGVSKEEYTDKAINFFNTENRMPTISEKYNEACNRSDRQDKVLIRLTEIEKALGVESNLILKQISITDNYTHD